MSSKKASPDDTQKETEEQIDFHGAAIIDESGKEVEITEEMVQEACHELEPELEEDPESSVRR